jgi:hypothetical protein
MIAMISTDTIFERRS